MHKPESNQNNSIKDNNTSSYDTSRIFPANETKPVTAHKVGENNDNTILRTEDGKLVLIPTKEVTIYKKSGFLLPRPITIGVFVILLVLSSIPKGAFKEEKKIDTKPVAVIQTETGSKETVLSEINLNDKSDNIGLLVNKPEDNSYWQNKYAYEDDRRPNTSWVKDIDEDRITEVSLRIISSDDSCIYSLSLKYYTDAYDYYKSLPRYYNPSEYHYYLEDEYNQDIIDQLIEIYKDLQTEMDLSDSALIRELINFVQNLEYTEDPLDEDGTVTEWPKYPIETLCDKGGDCEDKAILLAGILDKLGYDVCFITWENHIGVGIKGNDNMRGSYYEINNSKYFYIETTQPGWEIGEIPEEYINKYTDVFVVRK